LGKRNPRAKLAETPLRIGFDLSPLHAPPGGVGMYTASLYEQLGEQTSDELLPLAHRPLVSADPKQPDRHLPWLNKTAWMQLVLPLQLAHLRPDLCHFTNSVAPLLAPCPTVVTIHDMTLWLYPQLHYARRLLAMRSIIPPAARRSAAIITVSNSAKQDIIRILGVPSEKVEVIYEAAEPCFRPLPAATASEVAEQCLPLPPRFILHVGTIEPRKNLVRLIEAIALLRKQGTAPPPLLITGERGWKEDAIFAAVERLDLQDCVRFVGFVPREVLVALYNLADLLVLPSLYEGFGLPLIEAMACGTPVLTSASGSLAEIAGDAADFLEPTSVSSIAAAIEKLLADPARRDELRSRGLQRAAGFSWAATARQTRHLYARIAAQQA
jgi:glycosyltransferase involved in cell wall biosynthesis